MKTNLRKKIFIGAGILAALGFVAFEFVLGPLWSRHEEVLVRMERTETELKQLRGLLARYRQNSELLETLERSLIKIDDAFSLFSFLEETAGRAGVRDRLVAMNPSAPPGGEEYARREVEVQFEGMELSQLAGYLKAVSDAPRLIRVDRLRVERSARLPGKVRVVARLVAFGEKERPGVTR